MRAAGRGSPPDRRATQSPCTDQAGAARSAVIAPGLVPHPSMHSPIVGRGRAAPESKRRARTVGWPRRDLSLSPVAWVRRSLRGSAHRAPVFAPDAAVRLVAAWASRHDATKAGFQARSVVGGTIGNIRLGESLGAAAAGDRPDGAAQADAVAPVTAGGSDRSVTGADYRAAGSHPGRAPGGAPDSVGLATIWRAINRLDLTVKKTVHAAEQRRPDVVATPNIATGRREGRAREIERAGAVIGWQVLSESGRGTRGR